MDTKFSQQANIVVVKAQNNLGEKQLSIYRHLHCIVVVLRAITNPNFVFCEFCLLLHLLSVSNSQTNLNVGRLELYVMQYTVEPVNKGHFGSRAFVLFSEVVLWWEVRANMQFITPSRPNIPR